MGVIQVELPEGIQEIIDRQVAEGRAVNAAEFLAEAARRYAEDIEMEDELVAEAKAGISDIEAGRYTVIATARDLAAKEADVIARMRDRLAAHEG